MRAKATPQKMINIDEPIPVAKPEATSSAIVSVSLEFGDMNMSMRQPMLMRQVQIVRVFFET